MQAILAESPLATVVLARDLHVEYWNAAAERLFGWTAEELIGRAAIPMVPEGREAEAREFQGRLQAGEALHGVETIRLAKDGTPIDVAIYGAPFGEELGGGIAVRFADIRDRKRLEAERAQAQQAWRVEAERKSVLAEFLRLAAEAENERELLDHLVRGTERAVGATCLIYRPNPDRDELDVVAVAGHEPGQEERLRSMFAAQPWRVGEGIAGRAYASETTIARLSLTESERSAYLDSLPDDRRAAMAALDLRAMIAVPLHVGQRTIGVLGLTRFGSTARSFDQADVAFAQEIASGAAVGLARLELLSDRETTAREAEVLAAFVQAASEAGDERDVLVELSQRASDAVDGSLAVYRVGPGGRQLDVVALTSHDETADAFRAMYAVQPWRVDEGLMGLALAKGETVFRSYLSRPERQAYLASLPADRQPAMAARDLRGIIAIPLSTAGEQVGILTLARYGDRAKPFTERDRAFAEELARRAEFALLRIGLAREQAEDAERKALLAEFLASAASAENEQQVLEEAVRRTCDVLGGTSSVYRLTSDGAELDVVALEGDDEARLEALRAMFMRRRWRADEGTMGRALATGATVTGTYSTDEARAAYLASLPDDRRAAMASIDLRAIIAVPLTNDGLRTGVLSLARYGPDAAPYTERDRAFAEELAARTSIALARIAARAEREREARETRILAEFLEGVTEANGDENEILGRLAQAAATEMGDLCVIKLLTADRRFLDLRAAASRNPELAETVRSLYATNPLPADAGIDREVVATGRPVLAQLDPDEVRRQAYRGYEAVVAHEFVSQLAAPLRLREGVVGDIMLLREAPSAGYDERDLAFLVGLADRTSLTLARHRAERARDEATAELRRTSATLQTMFEASPLATQLLDADGRVVMWSPAAERLFGYSADEAIGVRPPSIPPEELPAALDMASRVGRGEVVDALPAKRVRKDGTAIDVLLYGAPIPDETGGTRLLGIYADMTERNRLLRELQQTSDTLRAILDSSPLPIVAVDEALLVTFWNKAAETLYGWTSDEVIGRLPPYGPEDDPTAVASAFARVAGEGQPVETEALRRTKDGRTIEVRFHSAPLHDEDGRFRGALGISEDVTERKKLEQQLLQAQKMEIVGRLAGGVAHDFNNILTAIIGYADIARASAAEPDVQAALTTIKTAAERAAGLTQQLLAFSRRQMLQPQVIEPNDVLLGMEAILRRLIGEDIELVSALTPNAGSVLVDRTQLEQVILNLAVNARDAMPQGGRLLLRTERLRLSGDHHLDMAAGSYVVISVIDTGIGIDEESRAHIFEPFYTTKEIGKGTGLGLATTYGIVRQSGGYIWVYSEPGHGTTFKLYFPAVGGQQPAAAEPERLAGRSRARILLVEDEPTLRDLARKILSRDGFEVVEAKDPATALSIAADESIEFDLLVTDVVMPGMRGIELARRLRESRPGLRVLFMSGYAEDVTDSAGAMARRFLAKPFTPDTLLRAVDDALTGRGSTEA